MKKLLYILIAAVAVQACTVPAQLTKESVYAGVYKERPLAIAIMPPINTTNNVEAKEFFYLTVPQVLCERGYYIISPFLAMEMYKSESAYDSEMFINSSLKQFGEILGADALLFTTISDWKKSAIAATITVSVEYNLRSTKTNETIFLRKGTIVYDTSINTGSAGALGALISIAASAINTAATNYTEVAHSCNQAAMADIPAGKYNPLFDTDQTAGAGEKEFKTTIKK